MTINLLLSACTAVAIVGGSTASPANGRKDDAHAAVMAAIDAMGGEQVLASVHSLEFDAIGHRNMLEQSLRPEGPWWQDYFQLDEIQDFSVQSERVTQLHRGYSSPQWWLQQKDWNSAPYYPTYVVSEGVVASDDAGKYAPYSNRYLQTAAEDLALGPIPLLHTALAAPDLRAEPDASLHEIPHHVLSFTWNGYPVRLYLNVYTHLPEMVQWTAPYAYDVFWGAWGDVTSRVTYGMWTLESNGLRYPRQRSVERNGLADSDVTVTALVINPAIDRESLTIPSDVRQAALARRHTLDNIPLGMTGNPAVEIEPGIWHIPGAWNVNLIRQPDGVVVLEGPISSGYSLKVLDEVARRFPGVPIKAVITTSDSWPHIGGLREYVARGIPIYALDLDKPILRRLFAAPHAYRPDDLQKHPHRPKWHLYSRRISLGQGPNRLELIPYRTETGERQTMVYFPEYELLYTSDLFAPDQNDSWFTPEYLYELREAVIREQLPVKNIFGMHYDVTPWATVTAALDRYLTVSPGAASRYPKL